MYKLKDKGIDNNLAKSESLSQRVVRGGTWVFALRITERGFSLVRLVILARILAPHDFGLMGIALLTMATLDTFSQTGFHAALIQKKNNTDSYLNAAWTVLILRGFILFTILFFIAPYAAIFFKAPQAKTIIQIIGLSVLLQAFTNIGVIYFRKELQFNKQFLYQLSGTLADFAMAVSAALILRSVWALVFGLLTGTIARLIASYLIHPYRPHLTSDLGKAKELFGFGKWILGSTILIFIGAYVDDISVGRLLGAAALGFYQMAYRISNMPATEITYVIAGVAFPTYSKLQDDQIRLQQAYFRIMRLTVAISIPIAVGIAFLAPDFTMIFLGEKWMPMVPVMQLLAVMGLIKSIISTGSPLFKGSGHPNFEFYMQLIRGLIVIVAVYPLTVYVGITGAALCVTLSMVGMLAIWYIFSRNITKASWRKYANSLRLPLLSSLFMAGGIHLAKSYWNPIHQPLALDALVFIGIITMSVFIYIVVMHVLQKYHPDYNVVDDIKLAYKSLISK